MTRNPILNRCVIVSATTWFLSGWLVQAADPKCFVRKSTWLETALASREALMQEENEVSRKNQAEKEADPVLKVFAPVDMKMTGEDEPKLLKIRVAGMKKVFLGSFGPREMFFGNIRLLKADGGELPAALGKVGVCNVDRHGHYRHDGQESWRPIKRGDRTFEKGAILNRSEIEFHLDGKVETLEAWVGCENKKAKEPVRVWMTWTSVARAEQQHEHELAELWSHALATFDDHVSGREYNLESRAGIWEASWTPGDWSELANRYARVCKEGRDKALELAAKAKSLSDLQQVRNMYYMPYIKARLALTEKTLAYVQKSVALPKLAGDLNTLRQQMAEVEKGGGSVEDLYAKVCELRRQIIMTHPLLDFPKLLVNKRSGFLPEHMCDQYLGRHSQVAPGLVVLENWRDKPKATVLMEGKLSAGGLIQPDLSYDGKKVLFAFAEHESARKGNLRGYHIYECSLESGTVRQVTGTEKDPMAGYLDRETVLSEDMDPCYLPDGGLAFISTRSQQFGRCHGGRYVPSYTLYRGELDGSGIRALSFNESNEWAPSVLRDGSLVYCRWDYVNRHDTIFQSLWAIHPDGTQTAHYYGNNSPAPCMISEPQVIPGTTKVVSTAAAHHGQTLGTLITVDPRKGQDFGEPLTWITPEIGFPESGTPKGMALAEMPLADDLQAEARAATPWPLSEDLFLCTYRHGSQYGIYLVDTLGGRELIYSDPDISCFDPIPLRPREMPPVMPSALVGREKMKTGVFFVQDVYQSTEPIPKNTIKSMRINEIISQPTSSAPPRSFANNELVKKVLGTVPVNPDGSVAFEAPASTPLQMQLLDENGMAVMTMRSLVYLQPGERASCVGCHEPRKDAPPPVKPALAKIHTIQPPVGPQYDCGMSYVRTVQPVWDRYCIGCHGLEKTEKNVDLTGIVMDKDEGGKKWRLHSAVKSYLHLLDVPGLVKVAPRNGETYPSHVNDYFAHAGKLAKLLLDGHPDKDGKKLVQVDRESFQRVVDWMDLNGQYYGDYSFNRVEDRGALPEGEKALREAIRKRFGEQLAGQPFAALVNVAVPEESRVLKAALPVAAGGWAQVKQGAFSGRDDSGFKEMVKLVEGSIKPLQYHDIAGTCGHENGCSCNCCWVRKDNAERKAKGLVASAK